MPGDAQGDRAEPRLSTTSARSSIRSERLFSLLIGLGYTSPLVLGFLAARRPPPDELAPLMVPPTAALAAATLAGDRLPGASPAVGSGGPNPMGFRAARPPPPLGDWPRVVPPLASSAAGVGVPKATAWPSRYAH